MAIELYKNALSETAPNWLDQINDQRLLQAYGDVYDYVINRAVTGANSGSVNTCDTSALTAHGSNRNLERASVDTDDSYRAYLKSAFNLWELAGTDTAINNALTRLGVTNKKIWHWQDLMNINVPKAFGGGYKTIAGANANGGLKYVSLSRGGDIVAQVSGNFGLSITATLTNFAPRQYTITVLYNAALTTANDVVKEWKKQEIKEKFGICIEATGNGTGLLGAGNITLELPIWSHFFIDIDEPNPYQLANKWDGGLANVKINAVASPIATDILAITGTTPTHMLAVGAGGKAMWYDGVSWVLGNAQTADALFDCHTHDKILGWAVGLGGIIRQYVGIGIFNITVSPIATDLYGVWSTSATNAWAVGAGGVILKYNGVSWTTDTSPVATDLTSIFATSATNAWAVGAGGVILNWDGAAWTSAASPTATDLKKVYGSSAGDIWAVGDNGVIIRYDGTSWAVVTSSTSKNLKSVWAFSQSLAVATGLDGTLLFWDGSFWSSSNSETNEHLYGVFGALGDDIWIIGANGTLKRQIASKFAEESIPASRALVGGVATSDNDIWVGGSNGTLIHYDGSNWAVAKSPLLPTAINDISLISSTMDGYVVGENGKIWYYSPGASPAYQLMKSPTTETLYGVYATATNNAFAVGVNGVIIHWDGTSWAAFSSPTSNALYSIWAPSVSNVWICGSGGLISSWDGTQWRQWSTGTTNTFYGITGSTVSNTIYAVGAGGKIVKIEAGVVTVETSGTTETLYGVTVRPSTGDVWACGNAGVILKRSGTWANDTSGITTPLYKIKCNDANGVVYAAGAAGKSLIRNPNWGSVATGTSESLISFDIAVWNNVVNAFAGTPTGATLRYSGTWANFINFGNALTTGRFFANNSSDIWGSTGTQTVIHWDGTQWTASVVPINMANMASQSVYNVFGFATDNVYAFGNGGYMARFNGILWSTITTPTTNLLQVMWGAAPDSMWVAGLGVFYSFDGTTFTSAGLPNTYNISSMFGFSKNEIYATGYDNNGALMLKYDGTSWTVVTTPTGYPTFTSIWGTSSNRIFILTSTNVVLLYNGVTFKILSLQNYYNLRMVVGTANTVYLVAADNATGAGKILKLLPDFLDNRWDAGGSWDLIETQPGITGDIKAAIRKWKSATSSCRFLRIHKDNTWVVIPVGELWELDADGNYTTKDYLYNY